jgi:hypothetical protein
MGDMMRRRRINVRNTIGERKMDEKKLEVRTNGETPWVNANAITGDTLVRVQGGARPWMTVAEIRQQPGNLQVNTQGGGGPWLPAGQVFRGKR